MRANLIPAAATAAAILLAGHALAAGDAEKCEASKLKASGKYGACYMGADSKSLLTGDPADFNKCADKQTSAFENAEAKYGLDCPTQDDEIEVRVALASYGACAASALETGSGDCSLSSQQLCGNGVIDAGEVCDQGALGGATCNSATSGAQPLGTVTCGAGCTSFNTTACVACAASNSTLVNGKCWVLGAAGDSCDAACSALGLAYDSDTEAVAGSGGVLSRCSAILNRLGALAAPSVDNVAAAGLGCYQHGLGSHYRDTTPTTSSAFGAIFRRACACS